MGERDRKQRCLSSSRASGRPWGLGKRLEVLALLAPAQRPVDALAAAAALNVAARDVYLGDRAGG
jgi:hypothetical protein